MHCQAWVKKIVGGYVQIQVCLVPPLGIFPGWVAIKLCECNLIPEHRLQYVTDAVFEDDFTEF